MDSRYYEKMLEVMGSLESAYSKSAAAKQQNGNFGIISDIECLSSPSSPQKMASSLAYSAPYNRSWSLFQIEKSQLDSCHVQRNHFRPNSKDLSKVSQERYSFDSFGKDKSFIPRSKDDSHIYEKVTISQVLRETESHTTDKERNSRGNTEALSFTIVNGSLPPIGHKDSLEIQKRKESRASIPKIPFEIESHNISVTLNSSDNEEPASSTILDSNFQNYLDDTNSLKISERKEIRGSILTESCSTDGENNSVSGKLEAPIERPKLPESARERSIMCEEEIIKFFMRDGTFSSQVITKFQTAITICNILKETYKIERETICQIIEHIEGESLERSLEDHENIIEVYYSWENENGVNHFIFQESIHPYKMFLQPSVYDYEISDTMWVKAVNSKWTRASCFIKDGSIFFTLKQGQRKPKHTYTLARMNKVDFYTCTNIKRIKKEYKCPTSELIVLKNYKLDHRLQENAYLAASSPEQMEKWMDAMKVAKFSFNQLKHNFLEYQMCFPTRIRSEINPQVSPGEPCHIFEPSSI